MPAAARLGDKAQVDADAHGCPACPHPCVGPIVVGSPNVNINSLPAARLDDLGVHAACCGSNTFTIAKGSPTVYVNGKPLARMNDKCTHCGGSGPIIAGSPDVMIDDGVPDAATVAAIKAITIAIKLAEAMKTAAAQAKKESDTERDPGSEKGSKGKSSTVPTHEAKESPKDKKEEEKKKKEEEKKEKEKKEKEKAEKEKKEKEKKEKEEKEAEITVQFSLHDAALPTQKLAHASVEYLVEGKKQEGKTDGSGNLTVKLKGKKGSTYDLTVKSTGPLPAIKYPPKKSGAAPAPSGSTELSGDVTVKELAEIMPGAETSQLEKYVKPLNKAMREFEINTPRRQAAFLAQIAEESGEFKWVEELGSGAEYNGRADLGNTHPGDGPKYKGRGLIQITGRNNYTAVGKALGVDLVDHPDDLMEPILACRASCYWYYARGLNKLADAGDFYEICVRVNGGTNGLAVREEYWARAKKVLGNAKVEPKEPAKSKEPSKPKEPEHSKSGETGKSGEAGKSGDKDKNKETKEGEGKDKDGKDKEKEGKGSEGKAPAETEKEKQEKTAKEKAEKEKSEKEEKEKAEKEKAAKEKKEKEEKEKEEKDKKAKEAEDEVTVELQLVDAAIPTQPLASADVEYTAYGKKHEGKTGKDGKLSAKIPGKKGGTFELVIKSQGELPALVVPPGSTKQAPPAEGSTEPTVDITVKELGEIMPQAEKSKLDTYCEPLNKAMLEFDIYSPRRQAAFLAQLAEESAQFKYVEEIGSGVEYNGRADLGNTHPGDGPKYKGRGLIQITGRTNYQNVGKALGVDLIDHPEKLMEPELACRASAYWYYARGLNQLADQGEFYQICVDVNGGTNGLSVREQYWATAKRVLGNSDRKETAPTHKPPDTTPKPVQVELLLTDAADASQVLKGAEVEIDVGGTKTTLTADANGKISHQLKNASAGTYTVVVKGQGVLPPLVIPPKKAAPTPPATGPESSDYNMVTAENLRQIDPNVDASDAAKYIDWINAAMAEFKINTPVRQAAFLGNILEESWDLKHTTEYGIPESQFMGRGLIQITGSANYEAVSKALGVNFVDDPQKLAEPEWAARGSAWWYTNEGLNSFASTSESDFEHICLVINGGTNGLDVRIANWKRALQVLKVGKVA